MKLARHLSSVGMAALCAVAQLNNAHAQASPELGLRADWLRGSWGALWLPEKTYSGRIEGVTIEPFIEQIAHLKTIDFVQLGLGCPSIYSPAHSAPHPIIESLWQGDTDDNGTPINLVVPRASEPDPFLSWLEALDEAGLKTQVYVNSYNLMARNPDSIPDGFPEFSARWKEYCDTNAETQAFITNHPYLEEGDHEDRKYMFCYAEFILKVYAVRYGDLIDAWLFDSADNIMETCGDDAGTGILEDQRIYEAFADACHAGNPNAAIAFNNSVGTAAKPFATPCLFDDYTFGHPFGGAGDMVETESLYTRNFGICEYMSTHNGLPFETTDSRDWNDNVVGHFFPKQSTTSWNAGANPCLTDEQFVEWTSVGVTDGGSIAWGTALWYVNLINPGYNLTLRDYALTQLELADAHLSENQYPDTPNWRRADTPLPDATSEVAYSHTLTDGFDFWDPDGGTITSLTLVNAPAWLSAGESSTGVWEISGTPTETVETEHSFELLISNGIEESTRTVELTVAESPILPTVSHSINGGATWADDGLELSYDNNGTTSDNRAITYSTQTYQSKGGFKLTAYYTTNIIGNNEGHNFSIGLISDETDLSSYTGFNPFAADTSVYSLGINITTNNGVAARGVNFTDGATLTTLDSAGTNVQFVKEASTPVVLEVGPDGYWSYSIDGTVEATGVIPDGFDLDKHYRVAIYGQDDNGGVKTIQSLELELLPLSGLVAHWPLDDGSAALVSDISGNAFHATLVNGANASGVQNDAINFNGADTGITPPIEAFDQVNNEITVAMWVNGAAEQPIAGTVFHAINSDGNRVLNIHVPWSNSKVFWDAGNDGDTDYDRISKVAIPSEFKERWNHWVFTKNAITGEMAIYLNGALWHSGTGMTKPMAGSTEAFIGSSASGAFYNGALDDILLYNTALTAAEVSTLYDSYTGYHTWLNQHGDLEDSSSEADQDGDCLPTILEYVLNLDPTVDDWDCLPTMVQDGDTLTLTLTRRASSTQDTTQLFEYSTNLVDWQEIKLSGDIGSEVSIGSAVDDTEDVSILLSTDSEENGKLFWRLKATKE
ncbi:LamG domain-containing protein [Rubritalea sp.]|uniref:LamG domain-containing protein n=1 Tax=Rubritalea sp. TaxID=2109375 RepID=UPI003EF695E2